ncbi:MAG: MFS transporter [Actinomycetota bacterium]
MTALLDRLRRSEELIVLCFATFLVMAGQGVVSPVIPLYAKDFGVSAATVGLTLTVFALARLIVNVPAGIIADRYGRRILLIGGPIITSIGMFGSGLSDSIGELLVWRFVAGAGSAFYMSGAMIYLIDIAAPEQRTRYVAVNQWALTLGFALGPGVGGLLGATYSLATPFYVVGGMGILTAVYAVIRLPETRDQAADEDADGDAPTMGAWTFALSRPFLLVALASATIFMTRAGTRATLMPLHADDALGWGPAEIGAVFTVTGLMTLFTLMPAAWASDHISRRFVVGFSGVFAGLGAALAGGIVTPLGFVLGNVVMSLGTGTAGPAPAAYVADIAPAGKRGLAVALYRSAGDVGFLAAPPLLGLLAEATSLSTALVVSGVIVAAGGLVFVAGSRGDPAAGRPVPATP